LLGICLIQSGCKETPEPVLPIVPVLRVKSISPSAVQNFDNLVVLELEYEDGDGDLGEEDPDKKTLWVKDSRLADADLYHVQPIAPPDENVPIQGIIRVEIPNVFIIGNGNSEEVFFRVKIQDRAGHWSEEDVSPSITITR